MLRILSIQSRVVKGVHDKITMRRWVIMGNKSFKIEEQFKYLERALRNQNSKREEFKR